MRRVFLLCCIVVALTARAAEFTINGRLLSVPDGFTVEVAAAPPLLDRPISADFDEHGRLYVTDSSGTNDKVDKQLADKPHRVLRLEDTDGDGRFDRRTVFAEKLMFPEGTMWLDGALFVAAPPSIWKLADTDGDGVADVRVEWFKGRTLTGCANDLHGPFRGPDGWIYWCKGAFAEQTYARPGKPPFVTKAAHIFRARPDCTGIEPVITGGMDNPVGLVFMRSGEPIVSCTFLQHPAAGRRDGLIHAVYGGVYGKPHDVLDGHPRTGDLMPIMTHLGPAAPAGIVRYESGAFGPEYRDNLFAACFNLHKVTRHIVEPDGATFRTRDEDFLASPDTDFHPTDVREAPDGSLLILDTGGWYKLCCPTSQLYKPDVLGTIYRVRKAGQQPAAPTAGAGTQPARPSFDGPDDDARLLALHFVSLQRDASAYEKTLALLESQNPRVQRAAAEALGRIGNRAAVPAILRAAAAGRDRILRHSLTFALIELADRQATEPGLQAESPWTRLTALHALDQMPGAQLRVEQLLAALRGQHAPLRDAALAIATRHGEWAPQLVAFTREQLAQPGADLRELAPLLRQIAARADVLPLLENSSQPATLAVLDAVAAAAAKDAPDDLRQALAGFISRGSSEVQAAAISAVRSLGGAQGKHVRAVLEAIALDPQAAAPIRLAACAGIADGLTPDAALWKLLIENLGAQTPFAQRSDAALAISRAKLAGPRLTELADALRTIGASELQKVLPVFASANDEALGYKLLASLKDSPGAAGLNEATLKPHLKHFPAPIQQAADALLASLRIDAAAQRARLDELASALRDGDIRRGQAVFNSTKSMCSTCHAIGYLGGDFGPDLTKIGTVRNERDLLEAIVFPSASFVRSYEPTTVTLKTGAIQNGLLREDTDAGIRLALAPGNELRIARGDIADIAPGAVSPMPLGLDKILTTQELADLIAFLKATRW